MLKKKRRIQILKRFSKLLTGIWQQGIVWYPVVLSAK